MDAVKLYGSFVVVMAFVLISLMPKIEGDKKQYYNNPHSLASEITVGDGVSGVAGWVSVKAESAYFSGDCDLDAILKRYNARVVLEERVDDIVCYYCRAYRLGQSVSIGGKKVNLHISVSPQGFVVGTPIICGGY